MAKELKSLREKSAAELREELLQLRRELFNLRMQHAAQQTSKTSELKRVRRGIARALTLIGEKARSA